MRNITAALLLTASFSLVAEESDNSKFLNTDVFELEIAADPQISPDGSQVAYVRQSMDIMTDRLNSNVWVVGANGRDHRPLCEPISGVPERMSAFPESEHSNYWNERETKVR